MIDHVHVERHYDTWVTTWTFLTWTHEYEYEHEHERFKWHGYTLAETCTWIYLENWYMVIIWAWQGHVDTVILGTWFTQDIHIL